MEDNSLNLRVMSFNIRTSTARDVRYAWSLRKHLVIQRIRSFDPDLLGLQECQDGEQAEFIKGQLPDYEFLGVQRSESGRAGGEMTPLLFRKESFELLESDHFWLSATPDEPGSKLFGAVFPRTATWAWLRPRQQPGQEIYFFNTHFDYMPHVLSPSAQLLRQRIATITSGVPTVVSGDFNTPAGGSAHRILTRPHDGEEIAGVPEGFVLSDTAANRGQEGGDRAGTIHKFGRINRPIVIDWILASNHFTVLDSSIDTYDEDGLYPSDHFPVTASLTL